MTTSTHKCEVIEVRPETHPYADTLSIVRPFGYTVCVRTQDWKPGDLGAYVVPDSLVNTERPEFRFLAKPESKSPWHRVKVMRLRQVYSQGLLIPAPKGSGVGDDVAEVLGIRRYDPEPEIKMQTDFETGPALDRCPSGKYDLESFYRYGQEVLVPGEPLVVTEKLDGSNSFFMYCQDRMWVSSRSGFKRQEPECLWWIALARTPGIESFCKANPGYRLYGEVFGNNRKMPYGPVAKSIRFGAFDIRCPDGSWMPPLEARKVADQVPWAPMLGDSIPYEFQSLIDLANGVSLVQDARHVREGIVVEPQIPRFHPVVGRVKLKIVSNQYLDKS